MVVLVDEYDKPILDALDEPERAKANRDDLRGLYGTLKDCDAHVELSFITGVSRFSKVSLFSGLNNLVDLTLDPDYSAICGYTDADLDRVFAPELPGLDRDEIRAWYDGYGWLGEEKVYNPFGLLKLFRSRRFEAHWFETGTPRFLVDTLIRRGVAASDLDDVHASEALLSEFDVDAIAPEALLFQTGYLTIRGEDRRGGRTVYRLGYPNREVRQGLSESLLDRLAPDPRRERHAARLYDVLASGDATGAEAPLRGLLAGIPHELASAERDRPLRGLLGERVLRALRRAGTGRGGGGHDQPRAAGPVGAAGGRTSTCSEFKVAESSGSVRAAERERELPEEHRRGAGATEGARLCGQVPRPGVCDPPDRRGRSASNRATSSRSRRNPPEWCERDSSPGPPFDLLDRDRPGCAGTRPTGDASTREVRSSWLSSGGSRRQVDPIDSLLGAQGSRRSHSRRLARGRPAA